MEVAIYSSENMEDYDMFKQWCEDKHFTISREYRDIIDSTMQKKQLLRDLIFRKYDTIIVNSLFDIVQTTSELLSLWQMLIENNVTVISKQEDINTSDASTQTLMNIYVELAKQDKLSIISKQKVTIATQANRGMPTAHAVLGYDYTRDKGLQINKKEAKIVQYIFSEFIEHHNMSLTATLCTDLGYRGKRGKYFRANSVAIILSNPIYLGYSTTRGRLFKSSHTPIISQEDFDMAQSIRELIGDCCDRPLPTDNNN